MARALAKGADVDTYDSLRPMVYQLAYRFAYRHKLDVDETIGQAHFYYQKAYADWNYRRGTFITYAQFRIVKGLAEEYRVLCKHTRLLPLKPLPDNYDREIRPSQFDLDYFILDLSKDARTLVLTTLEAGPEWFIRYGSDSNESRNQRKAVRQMMRMMGWSNVRIRVAWREVRRKLG